MNEFLKGFVRGTLWTWVFLGPPAIVKALTVATPAALFFATMVGMVLVFLLTYGRHVVLELEPLSHKLYRAKHKISPWRWWLTEYEKVCAENELYRLKVYIRSGTGEWEEKAVGTYRGGVFEPATPEDS